jgi:hypothetical protein
VFESSFAFLAGCVLTNALLSPSEPRDFMPDVVPIVTTALDYFADFPSRSVIRK